MGRPKNFVREDVLEKAMLLFWRRGFADTGLQDLEKATGVNKSGLYAEFKSKKGLFLATLRHYRDTRKARALLAVEPYGWANIEAYLRMLQSSAKERRGCYVVNSMRETTLLPPEAREIMTETRRGLKQLFQQNIAAERPKMAPEAVTELLATFYSGLCIEKNIELPEPTDKVSDFMQALRSL